MTKVLSKVCRIKCRTGCRWDTLAHGIRHDRRDLIRQLYLLQLVTVQLPCHSILTHMHSEHSFATPRHIITPWYFVDILQVCRLQRKACAGRMHLCSDVHAVLCHAVTCGANYMMQTAEQVEAFALNVCGNEPYFGCAILQSQEQTLLLEPSNAYRRAIQYQQLEKLQKGDRGNQGFYVQVCNSTIMIQQACRASSSVWSTYIWPDAPVL